MKINVPKIINVVLLILFIWLIGNCVIIHFHLSENMGQIISIHKKLGWSFLFFILLHLVSHLNYYKRIFSKDENN